MTDWFHCNGCLRKPSSSVSFLLSSCYHVFCSQCVEQSGGQMKSTCKVCGQQVRAVPINRSLPANMQLLFVDLGEVCRRQSKQFQQVMQFQSAQRQHKEKMFSQNFKRMQQAAKYCQENLKRLSGADKQNAVLRQKLDQVRREIQTLKSQVKQIENTKTPNAKSPRIEHYRRRPVLDSTNTPGLAMSTPSNPLLMSFDTTATEYGSPRQAPQSPQFSEITTPKMLGYGAKFGTSSTTNTTSKLNISNIFDQAPPRKSPSARSNDVFAAPSLSRQTRTPSAHIASLAI